MTENTDTLSPEVLADLKEKAEKAVYGDPADVEPWVCIGCGADSPRKIRPCDCPSQLVFIRSDLKRHAEWRVNPESDMPIPAKAVLSLLTALEEARSGLHGVMEAGRQEIALLRARAEKAEQQAAALMNAINKTIPLLEDEGVGWIARPLIAARDKPLADVLGAALSPNKSEADNA